MLSRPPWALAPATRWRHASSRLPALRGRGPRRGRPGGAGGEAAGPGERGVGLGTLDEGGDDVGGEPGGDLAGLVPAHAVADDEEAVGGEDGVLVELPPPADIRFPVDLKHVDDPRGEPGSPRCGWLAGMGLPPSPPALAGPLPAVWPGDGGRTPYCSRLPRPPLCAYFPP